MATTIPTPAKKRKNIDLPPEVLQKLAVLASAKGESLKAFIERTLTDLVKDIVINVGVKSPHVPDAGPSEIGDLGDLGGETPVCPQYPWLKIPKELKKEESLLWRRMQPDWENPSPSGDPYFDDPRNLADIDRGRADFIAGRYEILSMDEIDKLMGL